MRRVAGTIPNANKARSISTISADVKGRAWIFSDAKMHLTLRASALWRKCKIRMIGRSLSVHDRPNLPPLFVDGRPAVTRVNVLSHQIRNLAEV
jgi:hypothetical protein